jgi:ubiquinone/menaquinone biosynthesis C-methylase UbiE
VAALADAYSDQARRVASLLAPLALANLPLAHATPLAFGARLPLGQDLHSYYPNLHRDWAWGGGENADAQRLVSDALGEARPRLLVLGAGAGRLAYDLHQSGSSGLTVALDINPMLMLAAERIVRGGVIDLYEFPIAPRTATDAAVLRRLAAPAPARPGLHLVLADAWHAPFAPQSFDAVVTPWLIDIVEPAPAEIAAAINRLLVPGGRWVNFGSLSFPWRRPSLRPSAEELLEIVAAAGFSVDDRSDQDLAYMHSPSSRHARIERVFTFAADKVRRAPRVDAPFASAAWLEDPALPVPRDDSIGLAAEASRIRAIVLSLVDGRRSTADLVRIVVEQGLLPPAEAASAVRDLLERLHEEGARGVGP